jgi:hypothetical protein
MTVVLGVFSAPRFFGIMRQANIFIFTCSNCSQDLLLKRHMVHHWIPCKYLHRHWAFNGCPYYMRLLPRFGVRHLSSFGMVWVSGRSGALHPCWWCLSGKCRRLGHLTQSGLCRTFLYLVPLARCHSTYILFYRSSHPVTYLLTMSLPIFLLMIHKCLGEVEAWDFGIMSLVRQFNY